MFYESGTYFKLTASDSSGLGVVTNTGFTTAFKDITSLGTGGTCNVPTTSGTTAIRVYDLVGNYKDVSANTIDTTPPTIKSVTYSNGNYLITAKDAESGLWKVTNASGTAL